jgi:hypothetical protein
MPRTLDEAGLDEQERTALEDIERYGLHILHILPDGGTPGWSFSVGLWHRFRHPEVVVFGLAKDVGHHLLNHAADEIRAGRPFEAGKRYPDLLEGVDCAFRAVAPMWHHPFLGWADWYYGDEEYRALQCVWPDYEQHWPWEANFRPDWIWAQPLLWHTDPAPARAKELLDSMGIEFNSDGAA